MWIEQRKIQFAPLEIKQKNANYILEGHGHKLEITARQYQYWEQLHNGSNIHQMVKDFIGKGWLVSFREIYQLLDSMVDNNWILNPEIQSYFSMARTPISATGVSELSHYQGQIVANPELIRALPFFRTLNSDIQKVFVKNTSIKKVPANTRICKNGDTSREMFALLEGTLGVYRIFPDGKRQLLSTIPAGSIFGEGGFLLGRPRGADVLSLQASTIAVINHTQELADIVDSGKAESLQRRFWVLQGLLASDIFSRMPTETLDGLVFSGTIVNATEGQVLAREGEIGKSFFIIIQGSVAFSQKGKSLRALNQGGIFGEVALMVSGGTRTATAQAQRDSILLEIEMPEFYDILSNHLLLAKEIEDVAWKRWKSK